jgi:hypothetical protein
MWVPLVYLADGDQKDGSFRGEATKTAAEVPKYRRNPPAATRIGLAIWRIPVKSKVKPTALEFKGERGE